MSSDPRWERVRALFLAARELAPAERESLLEREEPDDAALRSEVLSLLAHEPAGAALLARPPLGPRPPEGPAPARIGGYRVLSELGRGGMGIVYLAEQESPRRTVALKLVPPGLASPTRLRRFALEAELLGRLQHPGIARIYEAGTADTGLGPQPWFAMEHVRGRRLGEWAAAEAPPLARRLELFAAICDAVQHAHEKGVLHRDLKPDNVLVDDEGLPHVLDFGVARALDHDLRASTLQTAPGEVLGTIPYVSPEQLAGDADEIDTRSDVWALGVLGYELVCGRLPHDIEGLALVDAAQKISEEDPLPLSRRAHGSRGAGGQLEVVLGKALSREKARRYASAAELAADVRRVLAGEAVLARPPSAVWHVARFARRHKALVGGTAAVVLALAAGLVAERRQARRATDEALAARSAEQRAQARTLAAEREARKARDLLGLLLGMLETSQPGVEGGGIELRVVDVLEHATRELESVPPQDPEVAAAFRAALGAAQLGLGRWEEAERLLRAALDEQTALLGPEADETLRTRSYLGQAAAELGRFPEAEALLRPVLAVQERRSGPASDDALYERASLAGVLVKAGRHAEGEQLLREGQTAAAGSESRAACLLRQNLGNLLVEVGEMAEGEELLRGAGACLARVLGAEHPDTLVARANLARALHLRGRTSEAAEILQGLTETRQRVLGPSHPDVWFARDDLAVLLVELGRAQEVEPLLRDNLARQTEALGERHPQVLRTMDSLGMTLRALGRDAEAREWLDRSLELHLEVLGERHPASLSALSHVATLDLAQGRPADALEKLRRVVDGRASVLGPEAPDTLVARNNFAMALVHLGRLEEAEALMRESLEIDERVKGRDHPDTITSLNNLAGVVRDRGRIDEALALYQDALARAGRGEDFAHLAGLHLNLARLHRRRAELADAIAHYADAARLAAERSGPHAHDALVARAERAGLLIAAGERERGMAELEVLRAEAAEAGEAGVAAEAARALAAARDGG